MKNHKNLFLFFLAFITFEANAQLSGKISLLADTIWTLSNKSGADLKVKGDKNGQFNVDISKIEKGIYSLGDVGEIYIQPDYKTNITSINRKYTVKGDGEIENNILKDAKNQLDKFLGNPGYAIKYNYLLTEPSVFMTILDNYVKMVSSKSEESSNIFFKDFIKQEAEFGKRYCLYAYTRFYGLDSSKMDALRKILAIPVAERKDDYRKNLMTAYQAQFSKRLTSSEKELLNKTIYSDWNINDEILYNNSSYYSDMISYRIEYLTYLPENQKLRDSLKNEDITKLNIAKTLISNSKINEDFTFTYTNQSIRKAKTPAEVAYIYESFSKNSKSEKHKLEIKKSYQNLSATLANLAAPDFSYTTPEGKMITLKSLRGKYIYIDVWATWCAPCIAEIPSLKKIEENYKNKNIKFVSISVDVVSNKQSWLDFIKKNNLQGIQLLADKDFSSDFIKKFGITSIPRFILIGPDGTIIDNNAKRPSDAKLITQLNTFKM